MRCFPPLPKRLKWLIKALLAHIIPRFGVPSTLQQIHFVSVITQQLSWTLGIKWILHAGPSPLVTWRGPVPPKTATNQTAWPCLLSRTLTHLRLLPRKPLELLCGHPFVLLLIAHSSTSLLPEDIWLILRFPQQLRQCADSHLPT
jgi:hypothetical protein